MQYTILMVLAPEDFRDIEYIVPKAFWERLGANVMTTSLCPVSRGKFGYEVHHKKLLGAYKPSDFDGLFFVGGEGALGFRENKEALSLTRNSLKQGKMLGAICAAPRNFLHWGILKGKSCTGHNWDQNFPALCEKYQAQYQERAVVVDGKILTANGPEASEEAAILFFKALEK